MCLIVFSTQSHRNYSLIFAGNRDEFHSRPTAPAHWDHHSGLLAGRDLKAGGTWLGVHRNGRFATVTNYREPGENRADAASRGALVTDILTSPDPADHFLKHIERTGEAYNGFNLIFGDPDQLFYTTNRASDAESLGPGTYGLSNGRLDTPWPKVQRAKKLFAESTAHASVDPEDLLTLLADEWRPSDEDLPRTGIGMRWERLASSIFIRDDEYGTRASSVVLIANDGTVTFVERSYAPGGVEVGTETFTFNIAREYPEGMMDARERNAD